MPRTTTPPPPPPPPPAKRIGAQRAAPASPQRPASPPRPSPQLATPIGVITRGPTHRYVVARIAPGYQAKRRNDPTCPRPEDLLVFIRAEPRLDPRNRQRADVWLIFRRQHAVKGAVNIEIPAYAMNSAPDALHTSDVVLSPLATKGRTGRRVAGATPPRPRPAVLPAPRVAETPRATVTKWHRYRPEAGGPPIEAEVHLPEILAPQTSGIPHNDPRTPPPTSVHDDRVRYLVAQLHDQLIAHVARHAPTPTLPPGNELDPTERGPSAGDVTPLRVAGTSLYVRVRANVD